MKETSYKIDETNQIIAFIVTDIVKLHFLKFICRKTVKYRQICYNQQTITRYIF